MPRPTDSSDTLTAQPPARLQVVSVMGAAVACKESAPTLRGEEEAEEAEEVVMEQRQQPVEGVPSRWNGLLLGTADWSNAWRA